MIRALTLIVLGAASFTAVYVLTPPRGAPTVAPHTAETPAASPTQVEAASAPPASADAPPQDTIGDVAFELRPGAGQAAAGRTSSRTIRDVTPDTMTAGPVVTGTLARAATPAPAAGAHKERLFNPIVVSAGTIKVRDREIHLAGIADTAFEKMCGTGGAAWPCGRLARAALRSFIHSRAIECDIPAGADKVPDPATCLVGTDNLSEWLVAQGWAKQSGDDFADVEKKAVQAKLGLWSDKRPDTQTSVAGAD